MHLRLAGKDGKRRDLLRSSLDHGATPFQAAARTVKYCILHLATSEALLCYPPSSYADLVACGDVLEHLLAMLQPGTARDRVTRDHLWRTYALTDQDWNDAYFSASMVVERC